MSASQHLNRLKGYLQSKTWTVAAAVGAYYAFKTLKDLAEEKHDELVDPARRAIRLGAIEANIFPHYFRNADGLRVYTRQWVVEKPKGAVFICHGFQEHINRYEHVARMLNKRGYSVYGVDHIGHGLSDGTRAYVQDLQHLVRDFLQFVLQTKKRLLAPDTPMVLLGHSMGGLVATHVAIQSPQAGIKWNGVALSAPLMAADPKVATPTMLWLAETLSGLLPKLALDKLDASAVSRIPAVVDNYKNDPLVPGAAMHARTGWSMAVGMKRAKEQCGLIEVPLLIMQGTDDRLVHPAGATILIEGVSSQDKRLSMYEGYYHELFNDVGADEVLEELMTWIEAKM